MIDIPNIDAYNREMRKSLIDKAFFLDKIDSRFIVDFGCGDASLLRLVSDIFPDYTLIGYDNDPRMVEIAEKAVRNGDYQKIIISDDWNEVESITRAARMASHSTTIVVSSMVHEVYSYLSAKEVDEFWDRVWGTGFDHVVVRDMFQWSFKIPMESDPDKVAKVRTVCVDRGIDVDGFESRWGSLTSAKNLTHFLMKYRYVENWDREVEEDYFPISLEQFESITEARGRDYEQVHYEYGPLPFNVRSIERDFGFRYTEPTHLKAIYSRR